MEKERQIIVRPATEEEEDGCFSFETKEFTAEELKVLGDGVKAEHASALSFSSLAWYSFTKNRKTTIVHSNEDYPIFMRECHTQGESFFKILKPLEPRREFRFMYLGKKEADYVNGLHELMEAYVNSAPNKLPEVVICHGDREAVQCLSKGHRPVWPNTCCDELTPGILRRLKSMCEKVCYLAESDAFGQNRANMIKLLYPEIEIIIDLL